MNEIKRHIPKSVKNQLQNRSNWFCEACGTDMITDKHHIYEWSKWWVHSLENLICLCPTCHRQIPSALNEKQQHQLQLWHTNSISWNWVSNHSFFSVKNEFIVGNNTYSWCKNILTINSSPIIFIKKMNSRYYVNIIMLDSGFDQKLLVLSNRVIYNDSYNLSQNVDSFVLKQKQGSFFLSFNKTDIVCNVNICISYKGKLYSYGKGNTQIGNFLTLGNCNMEGCYTALNIDI